MTRITRWLGIAALLLSVSATNVSATAIVFDNGAPNRADGFSLSDFLQADDFVLGATTTSMSVRFWSLEGLGAYLGSISWFIYGNAGGAPGGVLFSGTALPTRAPTGGSGGGFDEFVYNFDLLGVVLSAGTYWLGLHNGPIGDATFRDFYWGTTNPNGTFPSMGRDLVGGGGFFPNCGLGPCSQLAFLLEGEQGEAPIPEPASVLLLITGLGGLAVRKFNRN